MKTCASCKSPAKCKAAGKCLAKATMKGYKSGASLKPPPNPGAAALPTSVRNNMGFKKYGGSSQEDERWRQVHGGWHRYARQN